MGVAEGNVGYGYRIAEDPFGRRIGYGDAAIGKRRAADPAEDVDLQMQEVFGSDDAGNAGGGEKFPGPRCADHS